MKRPRTVCKIVLEVYADPQDDQPQVQESQDDYYLHHWGVRSEIVTDDNGQGLPLINTIAVLENLRTGMIEEYPPSMVKVIGVEKN